MREGKQKGKKQQIVDHIKDKRKERGEGKKRGGERRCELRGK